MDRLTIPEYEIMMEAATLKRVDADYRNHLQAYLNFAVKATKKSGNKQKPVYSKFKTFYDYEKEQKKALKKQDKKGRFSGVGKFFEKGE